MKIFDAIKEIKSIHYLEGSPQVVKTVASAFYSKIIEPVSSLVEEEGVFNIAIAAPDNLKGLGIDKEIKRQENYICLRIRESGSGWLIASHPNYLYSFVCHLFENLIDQDIDDYKDGRMITPAFNWQRISYDYFLTQEGRIQRNLNRESYVRELSRLGFTHAEVNGLAYPMSLETGPEGETYPMFYTYCPALDQFVSSGLNKGLYPAYYLSANLYFLKQNAALAVKYGLTPGLLCFEPRSVPERFFEKYPMLRGARVDHPFRSFKPRYNMTITHPLVREHYAEMMQNLLKEVPELGYIVIWTNDSGAGFEHTKSLYVGRNGGAYLLREWKDDAEIAKAAGENALRFFYTLRDAARAINPEFRVITRLESFAGEHDTVWNGLGDSVDAETASLLARGWDMPYTHPKYSDINTINTGGVHQLQFDPREKQPMTELEKKHGHTHFFFAFGPHTMFEPLLGTPYPNLTYQRLKQLRENNIAYLAHLGGTLPPEHVPYNVNHEIVRTYQFDSEMNIDECIEAMGKKWAGDRFFSELKKAWEFTEEAILAFPNVTPLYSTFGFTWYRLWARPFVPNISAIPIAQRRYYEDFMCTTPHNPNNIDLSQDVLFQLTTPEKSRLDVERIDGNVWTPIEKAIRILSGIENEADELRGENNIIRDQLVRIKALRCWFMTQRNVAAWIASVYGFMTASDESEKKSHRDLISDMINKEIKNSIELIELLNMEVEFMAMTDQGETPLMYGDNLHESLNTRIELMKKHIDDEPFIEPDYIFKMSGSPLVK